MRTQANKTILDDFGDSHQYFSTQHSGREGVRLASRVLKIVSGPIGALAAAAAGSEKGISGLTNGDVDLSPEGLATSFRSLATAIAEEGPESLLDDLFRHTVRDSKRLSGADFDVAFQGNYGELIEALVFVLRHNFETSLRRLPFVGSLSRSRTPNSTTSSLGAPSTGASGA